MLVITGWNSRIAEELRKLLDWQGDDYPREYQHEIARATYDDMPLDADRYFFCAGYLLPKKISEMSYEEFMATFGVNYTHVVGACDRILLVNKRARICVMGSESGYSGSHNELYAYAKSCLHKYVETKRLAPEQQLVAVAPSIIGDAGMTTRRTDGVELGLREAKHPKRRFANSYEVAKLVRFLLYEDAGYITNTVIRMHGGERIR